jgi:hypothetical protein
MERRASETDTHAAVGVDVVEENGDVVLEDSGGGALVELTSVTRVSSGPAVREREVSNGKSTGQSCRDGKRETNPMKSYFPPWSARKKGGSQKKTSKGRRRKRTVGVVVCGRQQCQSDLLGD